MLASLLMLSSHVSAKGFQLALGKKIRNMKKNITSTHNFSAKLEKFSEVVDWVADQIGEKKTEKAYYNLAWDWNIRFFNPMLTIFKGIAKNSTGDCEEFLEQVEEELVGVLRDNDAGKTRTPRQKDQVAYMQAKQWAKKIKKCALEIKKRALAVKIRSVKKHIAQAGMRQQDLQDSLGELFKSFAQQEEQAEELHADVEGELKENVFKLNELLESNNFTEEIINDLIQKITELKKSQTQSRNEL